MKPDNAMQLTLNSDTFATMKEDFDGILERTLENMETKRADQAVITVKLGISLSKQVKVLQEGEEDEARKEIVIPTFKHDISSVMQVKDKKSGSLSGAIELVYDKDQEQYVIKKIEDNQLSLFDEDDDVNEYSEEMDIEAVDEIDVNTPFGWLYQFVGQKMIVTEAMGNYTVRTEDNKIILSSASSEDDIFHCDAEKLAPHVGHNVVCVNYGYGQELPLNIAIECEDCCETLFSIDRELPDEEQLEKDGETGVDETEETTEEITEESVEKDAEEEDEEGYAYEAPDEE